MKNRRQQKGFQRHWQDLVSDHGFTGKYWIVRRHVAKLTAKRELPFRRLETDPGVEAQVDFGQGAWVAEADGKRRRPWVFRLILSHSRKEYSEVVWRQTTEMFNECLENAFWHFNRSIKKKQSSDLQQAPMNVWRFAKYLMALVSGPKA